MALTISDLMLVLECGVGNAEKVEEMVFSAKKEFVSRVHGYAITQYTKGAKAGRHKTYVGSPRKEVSRRTEKELYEYLYDYYKQTEQTFESVFFEKLDYKQNKLNRKPMTIDLERRLFNKHIPSEFGSTKIADITDDMCVLIIRSVARTHPKEEALRKIHQMLNSTFTFAIQHGYCYKNPAAAVDLTCFLQDCDLETKTDEEKQFSAEEIAMLREIAMQNATNPRALMMLLASYTAMRSGELAAIRWADVKGDYLHIHRQQRKDGNAYSDVLYTKNERKHPRDGRPFPITPAIRDVLTLAQELAGTSEYLFHDADGNPIRKDSYQLYLKRHARRLKIKATNNHAFRYAVNSHLIELGFSSADRALLLGHTVQTNETVYSITDNRRLDHISDVMNRCTP